MGVFSSLIFTQQVQHELHNATLHVDLNSNGVVRHKKSKGGVTSHDETDHKLVRAHSAESLDGFVHSKLHSSEEELARHNRVSHVYLRVSLYLLLLAAYCLRSLT